MNHLKPIIVDLNDLTERKIDIDIINLAFGKDSLGLIVVKNIPELKEMRENLIKAGRKFVSLPNHIKEKYEVEKAFYSVGWSFGKEKMKNNTPDFAKGSFYANPLHDNPAKNNQKLIEK